jgi:hypothetical protein
MMKRAMQGHPPHATKKMIYFFKGTGRSSTVSFNREKGVLHGLQRTETKNEAKN